ncbi:uncharacterized protein LOC119281681 [Triticum dicoccoides]|uniref:uncharacterized protein LOC119281681 n=1 Tax=Triticum dicoccoides TaxID=85692 RepID=UPI0018903734|nr:uncharacterized protein LOC119281681 [Triticum dicoccoides]
MAKFSKPFAHIFVKAAEVFCWFLGAGFPMFVLVLALTSFDSTDASSTPPSPSPPSHASTCDEDKLQRNISILLRYLVSLILASLLMMAFVRGVAEAASKDHERVAAKEDAYYKAACDAAEQAKDDHDKAKSTVDTLQNQRVAHASLAVARREEQRLSQESVRASANARFALPKEARGALR